MCVCLHVSVVRGQLQESFLIIHLVFEYSFQLAQDSPLDQAGCAASSWSLMYSPLQSSDCRQTLPSSVIFAWVLWMHYGFSCICVKHIPHLWPLFYTPMAICSCYMHLIQVNRLNTKLTLPTLCPLTCPFFIFLKWVLFPLCSKPGRHLCSPIAFSSSPSLTHQQRH